MKITFTFVLLLLLVNTSFSQIEINGSYSANGKGDAHGPGINVGYEFNINKRLGTKSQVGYKSLKAYNDFIDATIQNKIVEFHQTILYRLINHKKYKLVPNLGLNFRYLDYVLKMNPPYNTLPIRAWVLGVRNKTLVISSGDNRFEDTHTVSNLGITLQMQNQFKLNEKLWLLVTPIFEDAYDGAQGVGGCYFGLRYSFK